MSRRACPGSAVPQAVRLHARIQVAGHKRSVSTLALDAVTTVARGGRVGFSGWWLPDALPSSRFFAGGFGVTARRWDWVTGSRLLTAALVSVLPSFPFEKRA